MTGNNDKPNNNETPEKLAEESATEALENEALGEQSENETSVAEEPSAESQEPSETLSADQAEADKAAQEPTNTASAVKEKSGKKGFLFLLLLIFLLIAGLGVGAYFGWQEYQQQIERLAALENSTSQQSQNQEKLLSQVNEQQSEWAGEQQGQLKALQDAQVILQQRLDSHSARIQGLAGTSRQDWLLAEVRYLLRLANQRLLVEQSTIGAQGLLEAADNILQSIDDNGLLPVRDALAKELIALKIADTVDKEGLYLTISALKEQIQALPLIPFLKEEDNTETITLLDETEANQSDLKWHQKITVSIKNALANVSNLIQIRKHDTAPELLISEQQQYQVVNHLTLMLEQAQYALLHEKKDIYRDSLSKAEQWWSTYYGHYREHETIKNEITRLKQQAITQTLPDISRSSKLISEYIEQFHQTDRSTTVNNTSETNNEESN